MDARLRAGPGGQRRPRRGPSGVAARPGRHRRGPLAEAGPDLAARACASAARPGACTAWYAAPCTDPAARSGTGRSPRSSPAATALDPGPLRLARRDDRPARMKAAPGRDPGRVAGEEALGRPQPGARERRRDELLLVAGDFRIRRP